MIKQQYEMINELIMTIGHLTNEMEHISYMPYHKETTIRLKQLRQLRAQTANQFFKLIGIPLKLSHKHLEELKTHWCMIKHYATARIHMLELMEQYSTYMLGGMAREINTMLTQHDDGFWEYFDTLLNIIKKMNKIKDRKCKGCKKDIKVNKTNINFDDLLTGLYL